MTLVRLFPAKPMNIFPPQIRIAALARHSRFLPNMPAADASFGNGHPNRNEW